MYFCSLSGGFVGSLLNGYFRLICYDMASISVYVPMYIVQCRMLRLLRHISMTYALHMYACLVQGTLNTEFTPIHSRPGGDVVPGSVYFSFLFLLLSRRTTASGPRHHYTLLCLMPNTWTYCSLMLKPQRNRLDRKLSRIVSYSNNR